MNYLFASPNKILLSFIFVTTTYISQAQFYDKSDVLEKTQYGLSVCSTDWNKDGKTDYFAGGYAGEPLKLYVQQADGSYKSTVFEADKAYTEVHGLATGDFNKDGFPDVVLGGLPLSCLFGDGKNSYTKQVILAKESGTFINVADFDKNGTEDIAVLIEEQLVVFWVAANGSFESTPLMVRLNNLYSADLNNDGFLDLVGNSVKGDGLIALANDGQKKFSSLNITDKSASLIHLGDINDDALLDILAFDNAHNLVHIFVNEGNTVFKKKASVFTNASVVSMNLLDINLDYKVDILLTSYDGTLTFLMNNNDGTFSRTPSLAQIPNYLKSIQLLPTSTASTLLFLHTGSQATGIYSLFRPKMSSVLDQPFDIIQEKEALKNIQQELKKHYALDKGANDVYVFAYLEPIDVPNFKKGYLIEIDGDWYRFGEKGDLISAPLVETTPYSPLDKKTEFNEYSLDKEFAKNELNKKNGKSTSYACYIINDFLVEFYPSVVFEWQSTTNSYFSFKGSREHNKERHEIYLEWQNYADGLEWNFWTTDLFRAAADMPPFDVIKNDTVAIKIKNYIAARYAQKTAATLDVFRRATRSFVTPQKTENIPFKADEVPIYKTYGVYINGKLLVFDLEGNFLHRE